MPNQLPLADDIAFWSPQMMEHALFLNMLLDEPRLKAQARSLYDLWTRVLQRQAPIEPALSELLAFKRMVLARQERGEWLGWALPSFVQHILMEGEYFQRRLNAGTDVMRDMQTWLQIVKDHADVGPKLIDPKANAFADKAAPVSVKLGQLQQVCAGGISHQCLAGADQAMSQVNTWVENIPSGLNIVPPALKAHILRENNRGIQVTRALQQASR